MIGWNPSTLSWLAIIIDLRKGVISLVPEKGRGYEGHLLNYTILRGIWFTSVNSLLYNFITFCIHKVKDFIQNHLDL